MARNRKRAKERRARRTDGAGSRPRSRAGNAPSGSTSGEAAFGSTPLEAAPLEDPFGTPPEDGAPSPLEHAAPDVELADAQLALGSASLGDPAAPGPEPSYAEEPEYETDNGWADAPAATVAVGRSGRAGRIEPRVTLLARLIGFIQGSWRELQRVQWPDRRQVAQATSVVIGFVVLAGVFLGLADLAFSHLMDYILK